MANTNMDEGRVILASDATDVSTQVNQGSTPRVGSPISNEAYDIVAALHEKLEGLEAYRKYARDGNAELWQKLTQTEVSAVNVLVDRLEQLVRDGQFRLREPGETH